MRFQPTTATALFRTTATLFALSGSATAARSGARSILPLSRSTTLALVGAGVASTRLFSSSMPIPFFSSLFSSSAASRNMSYPVQKSDDEWRAVLSPEQFSVLRKQGTEAPFTGEYDKHMPSSGSYNCAGCNTPLYESTHKFKSGCGWPAFFDAIPGAIVRHEDRTLGMSRTEIVCANCGGHLGHVFKGEGYATPTDERHCVNSISLNFKNADKA